MKKGVFLLCGLFCLLVGFVGFSGCTGSTSTGSEIAEPVSDSYMSAKDIAEFVPEDVNFGMYYNWEKLSGDPPLMERILANSEGKLTDWGKYSILYLFPKQDGYLDTVRIFNYDNDPQSHITDIADSNSISDAGMYKGFSLSETDELYYAWNSDGHLISGSENSIKTCIDVMAGNEPSFCNNIGMDRISEFIDSGDIVFFGKDNEGKIYGYSIVFADGKEYAKIMVIQTGDSSVAEITDEIEQFTQKTKFRDVTVRQEGDYLQFSGEIDINDADYDGDISRPISYLFSIILSKM